MKYYNLFHTSYQNAQYLSYLYIIILFYYIHPVATRCFYFIICIYRLHCFHDAVYLLFYYIHHQTTRSILLLYGSCLFSFTRCCLFTFLLYSSCDRVMFLFIYESYTFYFRFIPFLFIVVIHTDYYNLILFTYPLNEFHEKAHKKLHVMYGVI